MELKKSQPVIEVNQSPIGVYIGSDIIEGYARLHPEEMEMPPKRREANEHAVYMANKAAIDKAIAKHYHRPLWLPNIPAWLLKKVLGEMSLIVLGSCATSNAKTKNTGFEFLAESFEKTLE